MPMILIKSRYQTKIKFKKQNQKSENQNQISSIPSSLQTFKHKLITIKSGIGFLVNEVFSKS